MKTLSLALSLALSPLAALGLAGCALDTGDATAPSQVDDHAEPGCGRDPLPGSCGSPEVHVFGIYETGSDPGSCNSAYVTIERPGNHVLVLSAYEATNWHVTLAPGAQVVAVSLIGYEAQTVDLPGVPITTGSGCGYSYPYNGQGCDTDALLQLAAAQAGAPITSFHGCYEASEWTLHPGGSVDSNCNTDAGYEVDELYSTCDGEPPPGPPPGDGWIPSNFASYMPPLCSGPRFVRYNATYNKWIGAVSCPGPDTYKLFMAEHPSELFAEIADTAGHGEDHCELVNPAFTLPDENDITSGGCATCALGPVFDPSFLPVYVRSTFGQPFERVIATPGNELSALRYSCGAAIP